MERSYLAMRYIIKAVDSPAGAPKHVTSDYYNYCILKRISAYSISGGLARLRNVYEVPSN